MNQIVTITTTTTTGATVTTTTTTATITATDVTSLTSSYQVPVDDEDFNVAVIIPGALNHGGGRGER